MSKYQEIESLVENHDCERLRFTFIILLPLEIEQEPEKA